MRVYKPSGIKWLGEIPKHWEVRKLGDICEIVMGEFLDFSPTAQNDNKASLICHSELSQESEESKKLPILDVKYLRNNGERKLASRGNLANINDRLILMDGENSGEIFITKEKGFLGSTLKKLKFSNLNQIEFVDFVLLCYKDFFKNNKKGTAIPHLDKHLFANHKIPLPPLQEQKEIAEFLDKKCEKIQNYINKKQKLITLLQEKKQALINEAVTKGLNPNIESKNSGIEYLGLIPHHWEVVKVKYIATTNIGLVYDPSEIATNENVGYPVLRANNIQNGKIDYKDVIYVAKKIDDKQLAISGDLLMCVRNGSENLLGKTAKIENNNFSFGAFTAIIRSDLNNYLYWIFQTEMLKKSISSFIVSIGIGQISQDDIKNFKIPLPPLQEQKEIAEFLDKKCEKINSAIEKTKRQIELIKEYKNTLINEAVCGRINLERK
ncbi:restriction endonuclease subunit S [Campylobacter helveticus]|uniref:restriction endonuclease subunit S n=1 Tax=Campylobacter helveticus TaxID=28898 RepID=UPI0021499E85|nr:restriction endonuclease subunit S [Campylobacter helveticus]MCR2066689.1 restriction endonuclease subunit S [Campylobacter helveticus]